MNCLLVPVLVKRSFSARETLFTLKAWVKGGTGKGKLLPDIHPAGSSYTGDKVFLCCGTKGDSV